MILATEARKTKRQPRLYVLVVATKSEERKARMVRSKSRLDYSWKSVKNKSNNGAAVETYVEKRSLRPESRQRSERDRRGVEW